MNSWCENVIFIILFKRQKILKTNTESFKQHFRYNSDNKKQVLYEEINHYGTEKEQVKTYERFQLNFLFILQHNFN